MLRRVARSIGARVSDVRDATSHLDAPVDMPDAELDDRDCLTRFAAHHRDLFNKEILSKMKTPRRACPCGRRERSAQLQNSLRRFAVREPHVQEVAAAVQGGDGEEERTARAG